VLLPKIKKIPKNTNGRLAIPAPAGLLVLDVAAWALGSIRLNQTTQHAFSTHHSLPKPYPTGETAGLARNYQ